MDTPRTSGLRRPLPAGATAWLLLLVLAGMPAILAAGGEGGWDPARLSSRDGGQPSRFGGEFRANVARPVVAVRRLAHVRPTPADRPSWDGLTPGLIGPTPWARSEGGGLAPALLGPHRLDLPPPTLG